jgi:hypothetical protein
MSKEIITQGQPFVVAVLDRSFGGRSKDVINVHSGNLDANGNATTLGQVVLGGEVVLGKPAVTVGALGAAAANKVQVTLQLQDCYGNPVASARRVFAWVSMTAGATTVGDDTTGLTTSVDTGVAITAVSGNVTADCLTDATGKLVIGLTDAAGATTRYVNFAVDGRIYSSGPATTT